MWSSDRAIQVISGRMCVAALVCSGGCQEKGRAPAQWISTRSRPEVHGISARELVASGRLSSPELVLRWFVRLLALPIDDLHVVQIVGEVAGVPVHRKLSKPTIQGLLLQIMNFPKVAFPFFTRTIALNLPWGCESGDP